MVKVGQRVGTVKLELIVGESKFRMEVKLKDMWISVVVGLFSYSLVPWWGYNACLSSKFKEAIATSNIGHTVP